CEDPFLKLLFSLAQQRGLGKRPFGNYFSFLSNASKKVMNAIKISHRSRLRLTAAEGCGRL
ncbi:MAG: hypothetical protein SPE62_00570, partial [Oscillospiraceae bacterium]|nr:hypothetical protein [Oscillospiraceae bacterium]